MPLIYFVLRFKRCFRIHNFAYLVSWVEFLICRVAFIIRCKCTIRGAISFYFILFLLSSFVLLYLLPNILTFPHFYSCIANMIVKSTNINIVARLRLLLVKGDLIFPEKYIMIFGKASKIRILWNHLEMS